MDEKIMEITLSFPHLGGVFYILTHVSICALLVEGATSGSCLEGAMFIKIPESSVIWSLFIFCLLCFSFFPPACYLLSYFLPYAWLIINPRQIPYDFHMLHVLFDTTFMRLIFRYLCNENKSIIYLPRHNVLIFLSFFAGSRKAHKQS